MNDTISIRCPLKYANRATRLQGAVRGTRAIA